MTRPGRAGAAAAIAAAALLSACQPLPHPFEDDRPPSSLLRVSDTIAVTIAPVVGDPAPVAAKLGDAIAQALQKHDVAASNKAAGLGAYQLYGRVLPDKAAHKAAPAGKSAKTAPAGKSDKTVRVMWRLYAPNGRTVAEHTVEAKAAAADWAAANDSAVQKLAAVSAEDLAPLFLDEGPKQAAVDENAGRTRVTIGKIAGAPGDGGTSLATAIGAVLAHKELSVVDPKDKTDLKVDAHVTVDPVKANMQHVKIVWRVRRADDAEIGTVGQENDVPRGTLDGPWGDLAYSVAIAATDGLMQVIARGAPAPEPAATARQAAAAPAR